MNVYFISGLAADRSVFKYIELPASYNPVHLDWISPLPAETLEGYALRLAEGIDVNQPFALIGLSFGGMLAVEIAKKWPPEILILISSIPSVTHLPVYYHAARRLRLHQILPVSFIQYAAYLKRLFTTETKADKHMLRNMIRNSDAHFIKWAMHAVLTWKGGEPPKPFYQIHGTRDAILPQRYTRPTHLISNGGHLMILNRARDINTILNALFTQHAVAKTG